MTMKPNPTLSAAEHDEYRSRVRRTFRALAHGIIALRPDLEPNLQKFKIPDFPFPRNYDANPESAIWQAAFALYYDFVKDCGVIAPVPQKVKQCIGSFRAYKYWFSQKQWRGKIDMFNVGVDVGFLPSFRLFATLWYLAESGQTKLVVEVLTEATAATLKRRLSLALREHGFGKGTRIGNQLHNFLQKVMKSYKA